MKASHPNESRDALDHLTKSQLRQQLAETLETLKQETEQLAAYQEQIQNAQEEIVELRERAANSRSAEKELEQTRSRLDEVSATSTKLRKQIDELKRSNHTLQKEKEELVNRLQAAEEKASRQIQINQRETGEAQRQRQQLEGKVSELEDRLLDLQKTAITLKEKLALSSQSEELPPEGVMAPKASFRIDLYAQEGSYHGKIEHLLSREKKAFKRLDQSEIMKFISRHFPLVEQQPDGVEAIATSVPEVTPAPVAHRSVEVGALLSNLNAMQPGLESPGDFVTCRKEPFEVQMKADLSNVRPADLPLVLRLRVYARHLQSKAAEMIGEKTSTITSAQMFPVKLQVKALPAGTYRLQADLTSKLIEGRTAPYTSFIEGGLVQIQ